jgi:hypothetical protein
MRFPVFCYDCQSNDRAVMVLWEWIKVQVEKHDTVQKLSLLFH